VSALENAGINYAPKEKPKPAVKPGEFVFSAVGLDHGHIYGMSGGLLEAGATLKWVYDPDPEKSAKFAETFKESGVRIASSEEEVFQDKEVSLIAGACVTSQRAALGIRAINAGKDFFVDKAPFTTLGQLADIKEAIQRTGKKYFVCYSERLQSEAAIYAGQLIEAGVIGKVVQTLGMGPHRLNAPYRPDWFFIKEFYGGALCDIGSHQIEQFMFYTGNEDATIVNSQFGNFCHPQYPELDDFADANLVGANGATGYFRVDWLTPQGLNGWGDGRTFILGTDGYIECRKGLDVAKNSLGEHVFFADKVGEHYFEATGKVGFPFFGEFILDCINRTEYAMTQEHALKAAELSVKAQMLARKVK
jgi:predicted dehydrogenase